MHFFILLIYLDELVKNLDKLLVDLAKMEKKQEELMILKDS
jgi:hypothetical protein